MCRAGNDILCRWQRSGEVPEAGEEGFDCFQNTGYGFCPKLQHKRCAPDASRYLEKGGAAERRRIMEVRTKVLATLTESFGDTFAGENGLIRTLRGGRGWAVAATVKYQDV